MAERTDPAEKRNHPFYCQYRAVYEYARQFTETHRVLDVGCGEGYGADLLAEDAKEVLAIDSDKKTIQRAKKKYARVGNLSFHIQDACQISGYPAFSFDVVCCFHVIEHLKDPEPFLSDIGNRLLAPSGILLISTPNRHSPLRRSTGLLWPYHEREYTASEFRALLLTGFKDVKLYALRGRSKVSEFQEIRAQHIKQIFRWDILKLRHWLPKRLLQFGFDIGGKLLKSVISAAHGDLMYGITVSDFYVSEKRPETGIDLVAVCRTPRHIK